VSSLLLYYVFMFSAVCHNTSLVNYAAFIRHKSNIVSTLITDTAWCTHQVVSVVCVVPLELMIIMTYTPSHNVVEKVVSPVCRCD